MCGPPLPLHLHRPVTLQANETATALREVTAATIAQTARTIYQTNAILVRALGCASWRVYDHACTACAPGRHLRACALGSVHRSVHHLHDLFIIQSIQAHTL